jgi:carbonic anhydrase
VLSQPITLDSAQLKQYEAVASGAGFLPNARPIRPLDGRQVNQFNFDVNFQNSSVAGPNFSLTRKA